MKKIILYISFFLIGWFGTISVFGALFAHHIEVKIPGLVCSSCGIGIKNKLKKNHFGNNAKVCSGAMITVLGTSLQNKDILTFFYNSSWNVIGLEMEGAHYQKAIQSASKIRRSISPKVEVRYAYYASDNPLETGSTLASGGLGTTGVRPTYLITEKILEQILK